MIPPRFGRRTLLTAAAAATVAATRPRAPDLASPADRLRTYMRMRGALDGRLVIGCIAGRYYGIVDATPQPLYGVVAATFSRYAAQPGGAYAGTSYEIPFFTDLATGAAMDRWRNPYTDQTVDVPGTGYPPARFTIAPDLSLHLAHAPPGMTLQDRVLPPQSIGDDLWFVEQTFSTLQPPAGQPLRYSELVTLHASRADLASDAPRVPCQTSFTSVAGWRPWLRMADRPGHLMGNGFGRYGVAMADLPPAWRAAAARLRPEVLKDPAALLPPA